VSIELDNPAAAVGPQFSGVVTDAPIAAGSGLASLSDVRLIAERVRAWMRDNVMGRDDVIELVLVALPGDGQVLPED